MGVYSKMLKRELENSLDKLYPMASFRFCFVNNQTLQSLFKFKDNLPELLQTGVIYKYNCPKCKLGTYIGSTERLLKVRIDSHKGVSHRRGSPLNVKENSAIRTHSENVEIKLIIKIS